MVTLELTEREAQDFMHIIVSARASLRGSAKSRRTNQHPGAENCERLADFTEELSRRVLPQMERLSVRRSKAT
jgi:hypothetical protein